VCFYWEVSSLLLLSSLSVLLFLVLFSPWIAGTYPSPSSSSKTVINALFKLGPTSRRRVAVSLCLFLCVVFVTCAMFFILLFLFRALPLPHTLWGEW
jgi:hypothetical protein